MEKTERLEQAEEELRKKAFYLKEVEEEKDMFFQTLNSIDEFIANSLAQPQVSENQTASQLLNQICDIMANSSGGDRLSALGLSAGKTKRVVNAGTIDVQMEE